MKRHHVEVKVGQHWQDRDKRMNGRTVRVEEIEERNRLRVRFAGIGTTEKVKVAVCRIGATNAWTRIDVERMQRRQGWLLVRDENGKPVTP